MTRWPGGPPAVPRPRSPHAHDTAAACPSCRDCPTCAAGTRPPTAYRVHRSPAGDPLHVCTGCEGRRRTCLNLTKELAR